MRDPLQLYLETAWALAQPRRSIPILVVSVPMMFAQYYYARGQWQAVALGLLMCGAFVGLGPYAWRQLFPPGVQGWIPVRFALYLVVGVIPALVGLVIPELTYVGHSFLTTPIDLTIVTTLFLTGGWGLGRDVEMELGLDAAQRQAEALRLEAEQAQLLAIRAHLDPHFLFNTLNAIAEWCREDGETAERAVLQLSAILREVLGGIQAPTWSLDRELDLVRNVLDLHRTRDPEWFTLNWDVPEPVPELQVPPMVLLPLAENAVKHGPAKGHRGEMGLQVAVADGALRVRITNPGVFGGEREGGQGLRTVRKRLELAYGREASLKIGTLGENTEAVLTLPTHPPERTT